MNLQATLTRCRYGNALIQLESRPFNGMEIRPTELRRLAQQLIATADMADRLPLGGKHWKPTRMMVGDATQQDWAAFVDMFGANHPADGVC